MTEGEIRAQLGKIAVSEIGKKHVLSVDVTSLEDIEGGEELQIAVKLRPDAPSVSGDNYISVLLKARDFLSAIGDARRPSIVLERAQSESASTAK